MTKPIQLVCEAGDQPVLYGYMNDAMSDLCGYRTRVHFLRFAHGRVVSASGVTNPWQPLLVYLMQGPLVSLLGTNMAPSDLVPYPAKDAMSWAH